MGQTEGQLLEESWPERALGNRALGTSSDLAPIGLSD